MLALSLSVLCLACPGQDTRSKPHATTLVADRGNARFDRLVVPVRVPIEERPHRTMGPALGAWIRELGHRRARRRAQARAWLERVDWRYADVLEACARGARAETRRALKCIVVRLRDRRYNGEPALSFVDETRFPPSR